MSTITTRVLSADSPNDSLSLSVDPSAVIVSSTNLTGSTGYYKLVINTITWEGSNLGSESITLDVRTPQFSPNNDTAIVDSNNGLVTIAAEDQAAVLDYDALIVSVNGGNPGPSVYVQGDGTWDLLKFNVQLSSVTAITDFVLSVDYDLEFVAVTNFSSLTSSTIELDINDSKDDDNLTVYAAPESGNGIYVFVPTSLATTVDDNQITGDSVPNFSVVNYADELGYGNNYALVTHPISKSSVHTKNYAASSFAFIFGVTNGKIDANGTVDRAFDNGSLVNKPLIANVSLARVAEWPCDDIVSAEFTFQVGFISA